MNYLTVEEVAAIFRVSKMTIYRMTQDGTLDSIRVGRQIRITIESVDALIKKGAT